MNSVGIVVFVRMVNTMKNKICAALLCAILIASLNGCAASTRDHENPALESTASTESESVSDIEMTGDSDTQPEKATGPESETASDEPQLPAEKEEEETTVTEPPAVTNKTESVSEQKPQQTEPADSAQPPAVSEPAASEPSEPVAPTEPVQSEEPEPAFDIGYWVSYAKNYAQSVGLELDSSATSCWDNPTIASANSKYLERDLCGMLDKYSRDADISAVWIWVEQRTESSWDIYIGYA